MSVKSLGNPFSSKTDLRHAADCGCHTCSASTPDVEDSIDLSTSEGMLERAVESAIVRSVFGQSDIGRRSFMGMMGGSTMAAALASVFPLNEAKAAILDKLGGTGKNRSEHRFCANHLCHADYHGPAFGVL